MNSVARLYDFLKVFKEFDENKKLESLLLEYFDLKSQKDPDFSRCMARFFAMPANAESLIQRFPHKLDRVIHTKWVAPVSAFYFNINLSEQLLNAKKRLPDHVVDSLALVAHAVEREVPSRNIHNKALSEIRDAFHAIIEDLLTSQDISEGARDYVIEQCYKVLDGIYDYYYFGDEKANLMVEAVYGSIISNADKVKEFKSCEGSEKFWNLIQRLSALVSLAKNSSAALPHINDFINKINDSS